MGHTSWGKDSRHTCHCRGNYVSLAGLLAKLQPRKFTMFFLQQDPKKSFVDEVEVCAVLRGPGGGLQLQEMGREDGETPLGGRVSHHLGHFILRGGADYLATKTQEPVSRVHRGNPGLSPDLHTEVTVSKMLGNTGRTRS